MNQASYAFKTAGMYTVEAIPLHSDFSFAKPICSHRLANDQFIFLYNYTFMVGVFPPANTSTSNSSSGVATDVVPKRICSGSDRGHWQLSHEIADIARQNFALYMILNSSLDDPAIHKASPNDLQGHTTLYCPDVL